MIDFLVEWGYIGLFIGAFIAATILPFSSDVMLVGLLATGSDPIMAITSATLGNWLGGLTSYYIGYLGKWEWIEKYLKVKHETLEAQSSKVKRYGALLALMTWLPIVGDVMAVALGFYRVKPVASAIYMLIGKGVRFILWALIYYWGKGLFG
ncbi:MAG: YqaA family protein [Rikenellaceae bacterium]